MLYLLDTDIANTPVSTPNPAQHNAALGRWQETSWLRCTWDRNWLQQWAAALFKHLTLRLSGYSSVFLSRVCVRAPWSCDIALTRQTNSSSRVKGVKCVFSRITDYTHLLWRKKVLEEKNLQLQCHHFTACNDWHVTNHATTQKGIFIPGLIRVCAGHYWRSLYSRHYWLLPASLSLSVIMRHR